MVMDRKGVSPVIATVLLLVLTIVIGGIIFSVVIPFVKDSLGDSRACLNVFEGVEFSESKFNCYNSTALNTGFSVKLKKEDIVGFRVALIGSTGSSDVVDIKEGATLINVRMVGSGPSGYNAILAFPSVGGQRSYVAQGRYEKAEISPITKSGEICAVADKIDFTSCYRDVVL